MRTTQGREIRVLLVADGSGGHLIPALQVANALVKTGARAHLWYAQRRALLPLTEALTHAGLDPAVEIASMPVGSAAGVMARLWRCGQLWHRAQRCFEAFAPDVVVGFGGWVSVPVLLAARLRKANGAARPAIGCLLHEQNAVMGRANRWLAPWVDRVAVSFPEAAPRRNGPPCTRAVQGGPAVLTGMPIRDGIGGASREAAARRFGFTPEAPTLLVLGGSQGARAINRLVVEMIERLSAEERRAWQLLHLVGGGDAPAIAARYAAHHVKAWVAPFLVEMEEAYAQAHLAIARAGASTIAELARCGVPAVLIPYPHAGRHQQANAGLVEAVGGGVVLEEPEATPVKLLEAVRRLLCDHERRAAMGRQIQTLHQPQAAARLSQAILALATRSSPLTTRHSSLITHGPPTTEFA